MNTVSKTRIEEATEKAMEAFWSVVAAEFPEAESGDLDPAEVFAFVQASQTAVDAWVFTNVEIDD